MRFAFTILSSLAFGLGPLADLRAAELAVGTATADITPPLPVALTGQFDLRIARTVESPLTAQAVAIESREGGKSLDVAVMVSCDIICIPPQLLARVREAVQKRVPDLDVQKIFLNGTHTHTAPVLKENDYSIPPDVLQVEPYHKLFAERVSEAIERAWKERRAGSVTWGLSHAVVAYNRRAAYADGTAQMYGSTNRPDFRNLEGYEDHDINTLFFWDQAGKLLAIAINVSCTAQEVEGRSAVNADFWHPVREALRKQYGADLCVLGWIGAAGDQSPHLMYRRAADERMRTLRQLGRMEEIARRITRAVDEAYEVVKNDRHADAPLVHKVQKLQLPMRLVTAAECAEATAACKQAQARIAANPKAAASEFRRLKWYEGTVQRFERQQTEAQPMFEMELHVVRLGDVAICTNAFELFTDFGIRIKARSPAVQTFVIQLVGQGGYMATERAVRGGHYSAIVHSCPVGPDGGQMLVERTVEELNVIWPAPKK